VAEAWHKAQPADIEPVLCLMEAAEKRKAFQKALQYLARAENINGVHPDVRRARLRLIAANAMRKIQQKKLKLAEEDLADLALLPQAQQGDRPAFLAGMRYMVGAVRGSAEEVAVQRAEIQRLLGSNVAANLLIATVAEACRRDALEILGPASALNGPDRGLLPSAAARVAALAADLNIPFSLPVSWVAAVAKQFPANHQSIDISPLRALGEVALRLRAPELTYAVSAAGLERGGPTDARFLLLRAQSLLAGSERRAVCAAAAAELAREQRAMDVVTDAVELLHDGLEAGRLTLSKAQAADVLRLEKAEPMSLERSRRGPDYSDLIDPDPCQCPNCRAARGEAVDPGEMDRLDDDDDEFDDEFDDDFGGLEIPADMPPEIARMLLEETKKAVERGETLEELLARLARPGFEPAPGRGGRKKGRRR